MRFFHFSGIFWWDCADFWLFLQDLRLLPAKTGAAPHFLVTVKINNALRSQKKYLIFGFYLVSAIHGYINTIKYYNFVRTLYRQFILRFFFFRSSPPFWTHVHTCHSNTHGNDVPVPVHRNTTKRYHRDEALSDACMVSSSQTTSLGDTDGLAPKPNTNNLHFTAVTFPWRTKTKHFLTQHKYIHKTRLIIWIVVLLLLLLLLLLRVSKIALCFFWRS